MFARMQSAPRPSPRELADRLVRGGTLLVLAQALRRRNANAIANALLMLPATYLPDAAEALYDVELRPWQRAYAQVAMLAHAAGFLGPYDESWWWDHLTHVLSASLLGGAVRVAARRRGRDPDRTVLAAVVGGGLVWEAGEFTIHAVSRRLGVEPLLVYYGPRDTVVDVCFNVVGALLVVAFGDRALRNFEESDDAGRSGSEPRRRRTAVDG